VPRACVRIVTIGQLGTERGITEREVYEGVAVGNPRP
jgi:hypothetical protein